MSSVIERYYYFIDREERLGNLRISVLCRKMGVDYSNWLKQKSNKKRKVICAEWLTYAVINLKANPLWLLTGQGPLKKEAPKIPLT